MGNSMRGKGNQKVSLDLYFERIQELLEQIRGTQTKAIKEAAAILASSLQRGGIIHTFGTGHSHMIAEEAFFRAGGLVPVNAILDGRLSFLDGALESTRAEREEGYAFELLSKERITAEDAAIIISNSGRNAVPVEMALEMKMRGVPVIAISNIRQSSSTPSRHRTGRRLYEIADLAIDTCVPAGDAILHLDPVEQRVGPASTVAGAMIVNSIIIEAILLLSQDGQPALVFPSANLTSTSDETIASLYRPFRGRIRCLDKT
jgi:uncharacterized phosphosugar-binding protein